MLDASKNVNKWRVTAASIPERVKTFIGTPLVLTADYSHPKWVDGGVIANIQAQEKYAIGRITDVLHKDGQWDAIIEITNPAAREAIEKQDIPFEVSPRIVHDPDADTENIAEWLGVHLAIVDKPAYGDKATFKGACYGMANECQLALKQAKAEDCGFCVKSALVKLANENNSSLTSLNSEGQNSQTSMGDSTPQTIDLSGYVPKGDYDALKTEVATYKQANADLSKNFEEFKASIIENERKAKITAVLSAKIADAKVRDERIKFFVDAKAAPEVVEIAYKDMPDISNKKDNSELFAAKPSDAKADRSGSYAKASAYFNTIVRGFEQ